MGTITGSKRTNRLKMASHALAVMIGAFITAYGLEAILIPNNVSDGGVTGLSIVGSQLFGLPLGILIAVLNIPFVILGYYQLGKSFAMYSVIGIASLAYGTSVMHRIPTIIEGDTLLVTVVGGIIIGFGMGIALRNGGALDGIDMLAVLLSRTITFWNKRSYFILKLICVYCCLVRIRSSRGFLIRNRLFYRFQGDCNR